MVTGKLSGNICDSNISQNIDHLTAPMHWMETPRPELMNHTLRTPALNCTLFFCRWKNLLTEIQQPLAHILFVGAIVPPYSSILLVS